MRGPWKTAGWEEWSTVRRDWVRGVWSYALGRPASEHPKYAAAVKRAKSGGWNPWWIKTWQDVTAVLAGCKFCEKSAQRALIFMTRYLRYPKEEGGGLVKLMDWQVYDVIAPLFGWLRASGFRRFNRGSLWVPKKNGKSFLCSLIALLFLVKSTERAPEVYVAAGDVEQAGIVYDEGSTLAKNSPQLSKRIRRVDSSRKLVLRNGRGKLRVLSSDASLAEGVKWNCVILDELHIQRREMLKTLKGGAVNRKEPLMLAISTAGVYDETSIWWEQWEYTDMVMSGVETNINYFAVKYGADAETDDWTSPAVWKKANPSWGEIITLEALKELYNEACAIPTGIPDFKRYHLNMPVHATTVWISRETWQARAARFDAAALLGNPCYGAMDLSETEDMTAMALWFPPHGGREQARLLVYYWLPEENLAVMGKRNGAPYVSWKERGLLLTTPGDFIDTDALRESVGDILGLFDVQEMAFDPYAAAAMMQHVQDMGIECRDFPQTTRNFNEPINQFQAAVKLGRMEHQGDEITRWQLGNCQVVYDSGGLKKLNKTQGTNVNKRGVKRSKIDGVVASVMACGLANKAKEGMPGILVL